jgi:hypothetical protein
MSNSHLLVQLAHRAQRFHESTGISQSMMAAAVKMTEPNYSSFLKGSRGLSAESTCLLLKFVNLPKQQAIATFTKPVLSSHILELQERGKAMTFDNSGWVAAEGNDAADPANTGDITNCPKAITETVANLVDVFSQLDYVTRKAIVDSLVKAHSSANSIPTSQKFSRKKK